MRKGIAQRVVRWIGLLGLIAVMTAAAGTAGAQESTLDIVKQRGTLIVGVKTDYPPYGYVDSTGTIAGFDIEMAKYVAAKLGVGIELRPVTSANRIPMLQSKTVDLLAASLSITRQRAEVVDFSIPYIGIGGVFVVKKGSGIKGYSDLAGKTVAVVQGAPSTQVLRREQPKATIVTFPDKPLAVQAVLQDKAAAFIEDAGPALIFTRQHPVLESVGESFEPQTLAMAMRQNDSKFRNAVNFALVDMWEDGTYLKLYRKFFESDPHPTFRIWPWPR